MPYPTKREAASSCYILIKYVAAVMCPTSNLGVHADAALLAEKDVLQRKAAMSTISAVDLRSLREQLQVDT